MTVRVKVGESSGSGVEKALRQLQKEVDREGGRRMARDRRYYKKPSIRKREKSKRALKYRK